MFIHVVGLKAPLQILVHFVSGSLFNVVGLKASTKLHYKYWYILFQVLCSMSLLSGWSGIITRLFITRPGQFGKNQVWHN